MYTGCGNTGATLNKNLLKIIIIQNRKQQDNINKTEYNTTNKTTIYITVIDKRMIAA